MIKKLSIFFFVIFLIGIASATPTINVSSPTGIYDYKKVGDSLNLNFTASDYNTEACWFNYNGTNLTATSSENSTIRLLRTNLIDYYPLDELSGNTAYDYLFAHNGTSSVGVTIGESGKSNYSYHIYPNNIYVNLWDMQYSNGTISFWFKSTATWNNTSENNAPLFDKGNTYLGADLRGSGDSIRKGALRFMVYNSSGVGNTLYSTTTSWTNGTWYHVAVSWGSAGMKMYINGVLENSSSYTGTYQNTTENLVMGKIGLGGNFDGNIDEFGLWDRQLNSTDVSYIYNNLDFYNNSITKNCSYVLNLTTNKNNLTVYANNSFGGLSNQTVSWDYKVFQNSQNYSSSAYETDLSNFQINLTIKSGYAITTPLINYDGINYTSTSDGTNGSYTSALEIPVSGGTIKSFYWLISYSNLTNSSDAGIIQTNATNQTINSISLASCTSATNRTLNFTAQNEEDLTSLNTWKFLATFEYWIGSGSVKKNVSINNLNINYSALCLNPAGNLTYRTDAIIQYEKDGYVKRNYYLYNASLTNSTQNITLYLLNTTAATAFIISVKDGSQLPITDAYVYIQRYYPGTGLFQTVSMSKTDGNGNTVAYFESETEDYRIIVMEDGVVVYTSQVQKVYCSATPCTLPIQTASAGISGWTRVGNLTNLIYYGPTYSNSTKLISYTYIDTSGTTSYGRLWVYSINAAYGKQTICNMTSTSNAATLTCNMTGLEGTYYAEGYISRSPEVLVWAVSFVINGLKAIMGFEGLFWAFIVISVLAIGGVLIGGIAGGIIGVIIGMIGATWLGIAQFGAVTIWGIIILGVFIIWQIKN